MIQSLNIKVRTSVFRGDFALQNNGVFLMLKSVFVSEFDSNFAPTVRFFWAVILFIFVASSQALAQGRIQDFELRTAGNLVSLCAELARMKGPGLVTKDSRSVACQSYIAGAVDSVDSVSALNNTDSLYCLPRGVGPFQLVKVVVSAGRRDPGAMSDPPNLFIIDSLIKKYPCH